MLFVAKIHVVGVTVFLLSTVTRRNAKDEKLKHRCPPEPGPDASSKAPILLPEAGKSPDFRLPRPPVASRAVAVNRAGTSDVPSRRESLAEETAQDGPYLARGWLERRGYDDRKLIALAMADESMAPSLYVGDTAIVDLTDTQPKDGEVFVVHYEGMVLIRRLVRDASAWWLCADSTDQRRFRRQQCTGPQCAIIGRIVYKLSENI